MNINKIRKQLLQESKIHASNFGWNENLFINMSQKSKYQYEEIRSFFPGGYKSLIQLYLDELNEKMTIDSKKINLLRLKLHERIRELVILRLKIMMKEKKLIIKTFLYLLLPHNLKFSSKNLYATIDQIWFLAGDTSTDFNFYSKRAILSSIYTITLIHFINNEDIDETIFILNKQLKRVSLIPKIKNKTKELFIFMPKFLKIGRKFSFFKQ